MMSLFDNEQIMKTYLEGYEKRNGKKIAERMIKKEKITLEDIADYVPSLSLDELKELEAEAMQLI